MGVTQEGDLFYVAYSDNESHVLSSEDDARTWTDVSPRLALGEANAHALSFDPYLYVDERTDRVFAADLSSTCSHMSFSDDGGRSWTTNPLVCGAAINDHHTLFAGPAVTSQPTGYEGVLYYCYNDVLASRCSKSPNGGLSFVPTGEAAFPPGPPPGGDPGRFCGGLHGHGVAGVDGQLYLPREYCGQPWLAISADEGASWRRVQVADLGAVYGDPSVDIDREGNIYYAWAAPDRRSYLSVSRDDGKTWGKPITVSPRSVVATNLLTIDVGDPGRVAFLYMGTEDRGVRKTWNGYMAVTTTALRRNPLVHTVQMNPESHPLKIGECGPGRCGNDILDFLDVVIDATGVPWGTFVDACDPLCEETGVEREEGYRFLDEDVDRALVGTLVGAPKLRNH